MNKKFSTLMAGLMLASAFSVSAQKSVTEYKDGKYYLLGNSKGYISVNSEAGEKYGELSMFKPTVSPATWTLEQTREALWKVSVTKGVNGNAPKYSFVNVATGMTLSVPTPDKNGLTEGQDDNTATPSVKALMISGGYMEWLNGGANSFSTSTSDEGEILYSYLNNTNADVVYFVYDQTNNDLYVKRSTYSNMTAASSGALTVKPWEAAVIDLSADDLNKELITNNDKGDFFNLTFNQDVTEGAENLFAGVDLVATKLYKKTDDLAGETDLSSEKNANYKYESSYVRVHVKDTKNYLVVDTALHTGSEADRQLPKFAYADPATSTVGDPINGNNLGRHSKAFNFKFAYEPTNDRVLIKVQEYPTRVNGWNNTPVLVEKGGEDGNDAYTYWPTTTTYKVKQSDGTYKSVTTDNKRFVDDAYVRLVTLSSVRELTVASGEADTNWSDPDDLTYGMLTTVKIGEGLMSYVPTTIDKSGLYLIQFVKNSANTEAAEGNYYVANLGGAFGYAEQAKNQDYQHIPAAQWYVEKQGTIGSAPITITNREFFDNENGVDKLGPDYQYQLFAVDGEEDTYFFRSNGAFSNDTVKFIPVKDVKDAKQGYKYVDEKTSTVETYVFNYLHGLAASSEVGLNTPITKDSLVRVDETGETIAFRLVPVVVDDSYGKQFDEKKQGIANLIRNAYYIKAYDEIKFAEDNRDRYLTYDTKSKKYVMSTTPTAYFLKENNCVGDVHYYALVEANLFKAYTDKYEESENGMIIPQFINQNDKVYYPASLAGKSLDDKEVEAYEKKWTDKESLLVYFYDKNGKFLVTDASENVPLYAYQANNDTKKIELQLVKKDKDNSGNSKTIYYYMNATGDYENCYVASNGKSGNEEAQATTKTKAYAYNRVSVDDNTLDLTLAAIEDKWNDEIRVSAFAVVENDAPLYRRFNGAAPETYGDASNAPLNLKFYRYNNDQEYLFENYSSENSYRDGINDKSISFLGVNNAMQFEETATRSYTMFVDTAYVRNNTRMPQYLIAVKPEVVEGDTLLCDASTHQHKTPEEALACEHSIIRPSFVRAMYLFNAQDSIDAKNYDYQGKAAYGAKDYTRLAFKDAVHAMDTLYILNPGVTTEQLIEDNFKNEDLFADKIALDNNKHKNVVFQFRLLDEKDNRFLIESEAEKDGAAVLNSKLDHVCVAPTAGGWVKVQNGVPVIARYQDFNEASAQADVFDVNDEIKYDATANDEIAVEGVSVVAGNGQVTIMGAAGKNVTITNILGKVIASQVIASDNATIAVPAGIVAVAVEGEAAVKAIVK